MYIVGELINASRKSVADFIENRNEKMIQKLALDQFHAGADFIDVNAGIFVNHEADYMKWLVTTVQEVVDVPCCIDSPDPRVIETALSVHKGVAMVNSITLEKERYNTLIPIIAGTDLQVVALCMSDQGIPKTVDDRLFIADKLINGLLKNNIPIENIYIDPLVQPLATKDTFGVEFLDAVEKVVTNFKGIHTLCGLSNISYGLPVRKLLNRTFLVMGMVKGLDGLMINPLDEELMASILAAEALLGKHKYCSEYLKAFRENRIS